ncbi:NYN domain-containing protein [Candidatus Bathyarchaeota archaeon]|nr:NYN domain-containing protein [Candidatus Bathyarchaeota archaeon]
MASETTKLAVLIDADNAQPSAIGPLLAEVTKYGTTFVRRAYGDWTGTSLRGWKEQLLTQSIQPIQQFAYTQGKNATDSAMIIDAMDLLYTNRLDGFCIVSSDSDFTRLASRIRESGLVVYGFGERKTPKPFVAACDKFIYVENILRQQQLTIPRPGSSSTAPPHRPAPPTMETQQHRMAIEAPPTMEKVPPGLETQLRMAIEATSDEEGWANLAKVGGLITKQHSDFDPRTYGYTKLGDLVLATGLFDVSRKRPAEGKPMVVYARDKRLKLASS